MLIARGKILKRKRGLVYRGAKKRETIDRMLNYVIWAAARNACMDLWSRIRTCSGKSVGLLWLLVLLTAGKSWKMSTVQVIS